MELKPFNEIISTIEEPLLSFKYCMLCDYIKIKTGQHFLSPLNSILEVSIQIPNTCLVGLWNLSYPIL